MRAGIVRSDLGPGIYSSDVENTSQRNFSSEPPGQSRVIRRPTTNDLTTLMNIYAFVSVRGTDMAVSVNTSVNFTLRIRSAGAATPYQVITVTSGAVTLKTRIRDDLNIGFRNLGLSFEASIAGTNQIQIDSKAPNSGPTAFLGIDSVANGSTLNTAVGFPVGITTIPGLAIASLQGAVYPTPTTINVSTANIAGLATFALLSTTKQAALVSAIAESIAPRFVETGPAMLSFAYGIFSKMNSVTFQPGGTRVGLPAGVAAAFLEDDGVTSYSL